MDPPPRLPASESDRLDSLFLCDGFVLDGHETGLPASRMGPYSAQNLIQPPLVSCMSSQWTGPQSAEGITPGPEDDKSAGQGHWHRYPDRCRHHLRAL